VAQVASVCAAASGAAPADSGLAASAAAIELGHDLIAGLQLRPEWTQWTGEPLPTAYPFGYLWPAASLFFWRRDHQIVARGIREACYLNLFDLVELGVPYSEYKSTIKSLARALSAALSWLPWFRAYAGCLAGPEAEPVLDPVSELPTAVPTLPPQLLYL